jgi:hypothetical protein
MAKSLRIGVSDGTLLGTYVLRCSVPLTATFSEMLALACRQVHPALPYDIWHASM